MDPYMSHAHLRELGLPSASCAAAPHPPDGATEPLVEAE